jgi:NAD(P)-dependent dehydrogenase (short-subunit alcohol dehydrogenase family)
VTLTANPEGAPLAGKHVVVTGGVRGIGAAVTRELLSHGARVTSIARSADSNSEEVLALKRCGDAEYVRADVTDAHQVRQAFESAVGCFGPVSILVNNAGQAASAPFLKTDAELWRRLMAVNLDGAYHCTQAALPGMLAAGWGRIVNIASVAGLTGASYVAAYCASKHALVGLTRALAMEFATKGVTVNAVCPGYTETDMTKSAVANITAKTSRTVQQAVAELVERNPQKRLVKPEEVANAVAWLCVPGSEAITGQAIVVAGGEVAA